MCSVRCNGRLNELNDCFFIFTIVKSPDLIHVNRPVSVADDDAVRFWTKVEHA